MHWLFYHYFWFFWFPKKTFFLKKSSSSGQAIFGPLNEPVSQKDGHETSVLESIGLHKPSYGDLYVKPCANNILNFYTCELCQVDVVGCNSNIFKLELFGSKTNGFRWPAARIDPQTGCKVNSFARISCIVFLKTHHIRSKFFLFPSFLRNTAERVDIFCQVMN